ncbi:hypothetical protein L198_07084 [Cryptococcus wingfieldii CBS 7118]|uniref:Importin N-terminal domain-containing protein n=1 Tax=Cryptococcus wingfieldii CBS 7118 TaxID=1295528 RepID=A0A1E3IEM5_9TREE|nr:hypothetical protein L198_07084 [Cryptococcus wingfieldii CBS 7118]ODN87082.1 hypothetical protein L198_07084 [Cryptococcus wingfieldii CBS 7118]
METETRRLLHAVAFPSPNEQYMKDQETFAALYKEPEFLVTLQLLSTDRGLSHNERLMASLVTSRELKTKWRNKTVVPESRKPGIRQSLFSFLHEAELGIARPQLSLLVAIARIEYPKTWVNLPQILLDALTSSANCLNDPLNIPADAAVVLLNVIWTINALVKDWRTVRVAQGAAAMQTFEQAFSGPMQSVMEVWARSAREGGGNATVEEAGRYAFKILARFCQWNWAKAKGIQSPEAIQRITLLLQHTVQYAPVLQSNRVQTISSGASQDKALRSAIKHLRSIGKWWRVMIATDPKRFCAIEGVTSGVGWWWSAVGGVVANSDGAVANDVFTPDFILSAFHLLVDKLLPLTSTDLEDLEDEPEEWLVRESNDEEAWAFEFRPCAERVLISLNNACRNVPKENRVIEPAMLKMVAETEGMSPNDLPNVLRLEAVYCTLGRLSRSMASYGGIDINNLLTQMGSWMGQDYPLHRIVKRRVAWLIGEWVTADEDSAKLPVIWQMLMYLLSERGSSSDKAVNLTSAIAVKECVDLWELPIDYFLPYLEQSVHELVKLLGEASTLDGKKYVNEAIGVVIERVGDKMLPYLPSVAQSIPVLWSSAGGLEGEWLFKASLVVLSTKLVTAAKERSGELMELVIPLIEESLQPPAKEFFEEDGLILWQTAIYNATSLHQPNVSTSLIHLLPGLLQVLGENMDLLSTLVGLVDSYLLLDAQNITQEYGQVLASSLNKALVTSGSNVGSVVRILETLVLWVSLVPVPSLHPLLLQSGIFSQITRSLEDDKASGQILASYLNVLANLAISDAGSFLQMVADAAAMEHKDPHQLLDEVLDAIWRNFDYVGGTKMRKAVAMGVGSLLLSGNQQVMERFDGEIMNIFLDVLGETQNNEAEGENGLLCWGDEHAIVWSDMQATPEGARRTAIESKDPAYAVPLKSFIIGTMTQGMTIGLLPYWEKADEGTKNSLEKFLA